jgi:hypothetical protein
VWGVGNRDINFPNHQSPITNLTLKQRLQNHLQEIARESDPYMASTGHFFVEEYIRQ